MANRRVLRSGVDFVSSPECQWAPEGAGGESAVAAPTDHHPLMIRELQLGCAKWVFRPLVPVRLNPIVRDRSPTRNQVF